MFILRPAGHIPRGFLKLGYFDNNNNNKKDEIGIFCICFL